MFYSLHTSALMLSTDGWMDEGLGLSMVVSAACMTGSGGSGGRLSGWDEKRSNKDTVSAGKC